MWIHLPLIQDCWHFLDFPSTFILETSFVMGQIGGTPCLSNRLNPRVPFDTMCGMWGDRLRVIKPWDIASCFKGQFFWVFCQSLQKQANSLYLSFLLLLRRFLESLLSHFLQDARAHWWCCFCGHPRKSTLKCFGFSCLFVPHFTHVKWCESNCAKKEARTTLKL